jgi:signal transduction histidine kinase
LLPEEKDAFVQAQRLQGLTHFSITPPGERSDYFPIIYLEPQDRRNRAAIGYDMFAEAVRNQAMSRARDEGRSAASGKVQLVQEIDPVKQPGFLLYMPVYRGGRVPATVVERRAQLLGFVYSPFRAHDLFQHIFPQSLPDVRFQIHEGSAPSPETLLFESEPREPDLTPLSAAVPFQFSGHRWTIQFETTREFAEGSHRFLIPWILSAGLAVSLLLFGITGALAAAHRQLRKAEAALKNHVDHLEETVAARTAELRESVSELEHMSYSLVHDMRAPLRAIQSFSTMLEESSGAGLKPDARDYLGRIRRAANRMDALIRDVLSYGEVVRQELPLCPLEVGPIVRGILESYPGLAEADITVADDIPPVLANEAALTQCFSNLLLNAVKFAKPGLSPKITITGQPLSNGVRVCVTDNGIGIPKPMHEKVFGLFERLDNTKEGTGVGLAMVRKAAERMGGTVSLDSEPGVGTRFCLELKSPNPDPESAIR